jgi:hypothetical protein
MKKGKENLTMAVLVLLSSNQKIRKLQLKFILVLIFQGK